MTRMGPMTDEQRGDRARQSVADALSAMRAGDPAEANQLLAHAVHAGVQPVDLVAEVVTQTGGQL